MPCKLHVSCRRQQWWVVRTFFPTSIFWSVTRYPRTIPSSTDLCIFSAFILAVCWREEGVPPQVWGRDKALPCPGWKAVSIFLCQRGWQRREWGRCWHGWARLKCWRADAVLMHLMVLVLCVFRNSLYSCSFTLCLLFCVLSGSRDCHAPTVAAALLLSWFCTCFSQKQGH